MKEVTAKLRNLQMSPRKVRLVADLVRGASLQDAKVQLTFSTKNAARPILKLIKSAEANADHNAQLDTSTLIVKAIMVNEGPTLKRFMPRAFGRATTLRKRMSHITVVLAGEEGKKVATKKKKVEKEESTDTEEVAKKPEKKMPSKAKRGSTKKADSKQTIQNHPRGQGK
jgi:large subunit ribosomal protein L22